MMDRTKATYEQFGGWGWNSEQLKFKGRRKNKRELKTSIDHYMIEERQISKALESFGELPALQMCLTTDEGKTHLP